MPQVVCDFETDDDAAQKTPVTVTSQGRLDNDDAHDLSCGPGKCWHCSCTQYDGTPGPDQQCRCGHYYNDHVEY
jgi:hypothetical protein